MLKKFCNPFLLSITGDSGSGKSYLKKVFEDVIKDDLLTIGGDGFHRWERNHAKWGKYTHLYPKANNLGSLYRVLVKLKKFQEVTMRHYDHKKGTFYKKKVKPCNIFLAEGLHFLATKKLSKIADLRVFLETENTTRINWKINRDIKERNYTKEKILAQIIQREKDSKKYIDSQKQHADIIIQYSIRGDVKSCQYFLKIVNWEKHLSALVDSNSLNLKYLFNFFKEYLDIQKQEEGYRFSYQENTPSFLIEDFFAFLKAEYSQHNFLIDLNFDKYPLIDIFTLCLLLFNMLIIIREKECLK